MAVVPSKPLVGQEPQVRRATAPESAPALTFCTADRSALQSTRANMLAPLALVRWSAATRASY
eukprot:2283293-Amphidinium_carterae.1